MADVRDGPGGPAPLPPPYFGWKKKKESQREEKPAGQVTKNQVPPLAQSLDPPLLMYGNMLIFLIVFVKINHLLRI